MQPIVWKTGGELVDARRRFRELGQHLLTREGTAWHAQ
jgi:hypothetical protein